MGETIDWSEVRDGKNDKGTNTQKPQLRLIFFYYVTQI